jgi:hypothetical protein
LRPADLSAILPEKHCPVLDHAKEHNINLVNNMSGCFAPHAGHENALNFGTKWDQAPVFREAGSPRGYTCLQRSGLCSDRQHDEEIDSPMTRDPVSGKEFRSEVDRISDHSSDEFSYQFAEESHEKEELRSTAEGVYFFPAASSTIAQSKDNMLALSFSNQESAFFPKNHPQMTFSLQKLVYYPLIGEHVLFS